MIVLYGKVNRGEDESTRGKFSYKLWTPTAELRFSGHISKDTEVDHGEVSIDPSKGVIERYDTSKECLAQLKKAVAAAGKGGILVDLSDAKTFKVTDLDPDPDPEPESVPEPAPDPESDSGAESDEQ